MSFLHISGMTTSQRASWHYTTEEQPVAQRRQLHSSRSSLNATREQWTRLAFRCWSQMPSPQYGKRSNAICPAFKTHPEFSCTSRLAPWRRARRYCPRTDAAEVQPLLKVSTSTSTGSYQVLCPIIFNCNTFREIGELCTSLINIAY